MELYHRLHSETQCARDKLMTTPYVQRCMRGDISKEDYLHFLGEAYHYVKHLVPLMMACGSRLDDDKEWLREALGDFSEEEMGHQEWLLNDVEASGGDKLATKQQGPCPATELLIAYAYDAVHRKHPLYLMGLLFVLKGTVIVLADKVSLMMGELLDVSEGAFTYLRAQGVLYQTHMLYFEELMNKITDQSEQDMVVHSANMFFRLHAELFVEIDALGEQNRLAAFL